MGVSRVIRRHRMIKRDKRLQKRKWRMVKVNIHCNMKPFIVSIDKASKEFCKTVILQYYRSEGEMEFLHHLIPEFCNSVPKERGE
jgi:hypothetical protein